MKKIKKDAKISQKCFFFVQNYHDATLNSTRTILMLNRQMISIEV